MKFTEYLTEAKEGKNVHLEHIEDEIINRGVTGARESINFLQSLRSATSSCRSSLLSC
jgi:hypothetical protein